MSRRLVLFDIDGTLVEGMAAKHAFIGALEEVFGTAGPLQEVEFSGKTDPQIARELMRGAGLGDEEIDAGLPELWRRYTAGLRNGVRDEPYRALGGVGPLLQALEAEAAVLGLLTGNIVEGARIKLGSAGVATDFPVGAFGSDAENRNHLPEVALERARESGLAFEPDELVVVGDTPRDVECGLHIGARTVAVATGRYEMGALEAAGAGRVLRDLTELDRTLEAIFG